MDRIYKKKKKVANGGTQIFTHGQISQSCIGDVSPLQPH